MRHILAFVLVVSAIAARGQEIEPKKNNFKLKIPLNYRGYFSDRLAGGIQYERAISRANSVVLGAGYFRTYYHFYLGTNPRPYHFTKEIGSLALPAYSVSPPGLPDGLDGETYQQIFLSAQGRHYFNRNRTSRNTRIFAGIAAGYLADGFVSDYWKTTPTYGYAEKRKMGAAGPVIGLQGVIRHRLLLEFAPSLLLGNAWVERQARRKPPGGAGQWPIVTQRSTGLVFILNADLSVGYSF